MHGHQTTLFSNKYQADAINAMIDLYGVSGSVEFPDDATKEQMRRGWNGRTKGKLTPLMMDESMIARFKQSMESHSVDIVICDFSTGFGAKAADEMRIPTIILAPVPLQAFETMCLFKILSKERACRCTCCLCIRPTCRDWTLSSFHSRVLGNDLSEFYRQHMHRTVICTSFMGFDKACHMPPNIHFTGPHYD